VFLKNTNGLQFEDFCLKKRKNAERLFQAGPYLVYNNHMENHMEK